jgi:hypothetical protein
LDECSNAEKHDVSYQNTVGFPINRKNSHESYDHEVHQERRVDDVSVFESEVVLEVEVNLISPLEGAISKALFLSYDINSLSVEHVVELNRQKHQCKQNPQQCLALYVLYRMVESLTIPKTYFFNIQNVSRAFKLAHHFIRLII